jgi:hypothetical protein
MDKPKKDSSRAPEMLLWEIPFEFISPLSLDECSSRIHDINAHKPFLASRRKVFLSSIEPHKILFHLSEPGGKLGDGWAVGYLEESADAQTIVTGNVGISPENIFLLGALGLMGIVVLLTEIPSLRALLVTVTIVGSIYAAVFFAIRGIRSNLINQLRNVLVETEDEYTGSN